MGYITDLNECTDPVTGDFMMIADASASAGDRDRKVNLSRFAILATTQSFTSQQTIAPSTTGDDGLRVNMPTSTTGWAHRIYYNSVARAQIKQSATENYMQLLGMDAGTAGGNGLFLSRNTNASTPAAAFFNMQSQTGGYNIWVDNAGNLRIWSGGSPTYANDTSGTVVGTQTSHAEFKNVVGEAVNGAEAVRQLGEAAKQVRRFVYKDGSFNGEEFSGLVLDGDGLHRYGMDADAEHPAGKSLNVINLLGDLLLAVDTLTQRIQALEEGE